MTHNELNNTYENWMQRNANLRRVVKDESETPERQLKAIHLSNIMIDRLLKINAYLLRSLQTPRTPQFPLGGTIISDKEVIILNDNSEHVIKPRKS